MTDKNKKTPKTMEDLCELMVQFRDEQQGMRCELTGMRSELTGALKRLDELEKNVDGRMSTIESRQEEVESTKCSKQDLKDTASTLRDEIKEEKDKLSRKTNVVIFGIKEDEEGELLFINLMKLIGDHVPAPYVERIGLAEKSDSRPIRVCLPTMQAKRLLFKNCSKMKDREDLKKVRVDHDLTKKQIDAKSKLRSHGNAGKPIPPAGTPTPPSENPTPPTENSKDNDMDVDEAAANNKENNGNETNDDPDSDVPDPKKPRLV